MRKTILVLQGKSKTGKSETISFLYDKLKKDKPIIIKDKRIKNSKDFNYVIIKINKVRIGITTCGDVPKLVRKFLQIMIKEKCRILICACHNTVNSIEAFINLKEFRRANIYFIPKKASINENKTEMLKYNKYDSNILYNKLFDMLK